MCRGTSFTPFLDLGFHPPSDRFLSSDELNQPEPRFPLRVVICDQCSLVQLDYIVSGEVLYCQHYPYESSTTRMGFAHWSEFADTASTRLGLGRDDLVIDIGSNVGVLLERFNASSGVRVLGVDPAANIANIANLRSIETIAAFFNLETAKRIVASKGQARVITATNVFAHIDDLDDLMAAVKVLLHDDGAFIIEVPYLANLIERLEYDTIYHEHLSYISILPLSRFVERHGMEIADVQQRDIHGGSVRVWMQRKGQGRLKPTGAAADLIALENYKEIHSIDRLRAFAADVEANRRELLWLLDRLKDDGKRIVAVSAPAKGMTLLNYCDLGTDVLSYVTEKSKLKIGRYTPGGHIPVVEDGRLAADKPDFALLLAWNFADEIIANLRDYSKVGGRFIIPLPRPQIMD